MCLNHDLETKPCLLVQHSFLYYCLLFLCVWTLLGIICSLPQLGWELGLMVLLLLIMMMDKIYEEY